MDNVKKIWSIAAIVALCAACYWLGGRNAPAADVYNNTDRTLERAKEQQQRISDEIAGSRAAIIDAANANERATDAVSRSQSAAQEIAGSIDAIRRKVEECRKLAERNAELINELGKDT